MSSYRYLSFDTGRAVISRLVVLNASSSSFLSEWEIFLELPSPYRPPEAGTLSDRRPNLAKTWLEIQRKIDFSYDTTYMPSTRPVIVFW